MNRLSRRSRFSLGVSGYVIVCAIGVMINDAFTPFLLVGLAVLLVLVLSSSLG